MLCASRCPLLRGVPRQRRGMFSSEGSKHPVNVCRRAGVCFLQKGAALAAGYVFLRGEQTSSECLPPAAGYVLSASFSYPPASPYPFEKGTRGSATLHASLSIVVYNVMRQPSPLQRGAALAAGYVFFRGEQTSSECLPKSRGMFPSEGSKHPVNVCRQRRGMSPTRSTLLLFTFYLLV